MNVIGAVKAYVTKMTSESEPGMKILVMDKETTSIISMVYSQSEIQQREVFLLERIDSSSNLNNNSGLRYLKCLMFLRPTPQNIDLLCKELRSPKYGAYYIYFSNILAKADVKCLAESDEQEVVKEIQELYMDYLAVNPHLFSIGVQNCAKWEIAALQRTVQGLVAVLLSIKKCPIIRYQKNSKPCEELAQKVDEVIQKESTLFVYNKSNHPLLLILDRKDDPVTPLLNQWTYQAMVHELLGIHNNRVNLSNISGVAKELAEVVLSAEQDVFYAKNIFLNFGEIGQNIKELMEHFQAKAKSHKKVESIADMKAFVETYPQFKKLSGDVAKHVTIVEQLSSMVSKYCLLDVSEVEQEVTSQADNSSHMQSIRRLLENPNVRNSDAVKLVILYALKYQNRSSDIAALEKALKRKGVPESLIMSVSNVLKYAGSHARQNELFNVGEAVKITKRFFKGLSGVENVYTQHKPVLYETLEHLLKGRLREDLYPYFKNRSSIGQPQEIIIFMVGGTTYEESLVVHTFNRNHPSSHIILGGTSVHNSTSFLDEINQAMRNVTK